MLHFAANSRVFPMRLGMDVVCLKALLRATALLQQCHVSLCYQTYTESQAGHKQGIQDNSIVLSQELSKTLPDSGLLKSKHRKRDSHFARGWDDRVEGKNTGQRGRKGGMKEYILIKTASYKILKENIVLKRKRQKNSVRYAEKRGWRRWIWEE